MKNKEKKLLVLAEIIALQTVIKEEPDYTTQQLLQKKIDEKGRELIALVTEEE